jgi:hypothetical protein
VKTGSVKLSAKEVRNPENVDGSQTGRIILEAATDDPTTNEINIIFRIRKRQ